MKEHKQILIETKNFYAGNNLNFSLTWLIRSWFWLSMDQEKLQDK
jgi:hypothetical protein